MRHKTLWWCLIYTIFQTIGTSPSLATTVTWDGDAANMQWSDPDNWDDDVLPTANDDVIIQGDMVELMTTVTVRSIYLEDAHLMILDPGHLTVQFNIANYGIELVDAQLSIKSYTDIRAGDYYGLRLDAMSLVEVFDTLEVHEGGIFNMGSITNEGSIQLFPTSNLDSYAIGVDNRGSWQSKNPSELEITGPTNFDFTAILNSGGGTTFINRGCIKIEHAYDGIRNTASFTNYGTLNIHGIKQDGISNEFSSASFTNHLGASIVLESANSTIGGFTANIENIAPFMNHGDIHILDMPENGIRNLNSFTNTGQIIIDPGISLAAIQNDYANANFINSGVIDINSIANSVLCRGSSFTNESSGELKLVGSQSIFRRSLHLKDNATFTNHGSLELDPNTDTDFLEVELGSVFDCPGTLDMN